MKTPKVMPTTLLLITMAISVQIFNKAMEHSAGRQMGKTSK
jgi:hypothetical protein